ncbi:MAG: molecular chaperone TorD family protein [Campylobacter sp.]|nr:molecular chaperone TorD family protein [Campylobacter sp.]
MQIDKTALNAGRVTYYSLLSRLFVFSYSSDRFDGVREALDKFATNPLSPQSSQALKELQNSLLNGYEPLAGEFDDIFNAPPKPVRSTVSYYDEGYEIGQACAKIRAILARTTIRKDESKFKENEDNFGFIFALMAEFLKDQSDESEALVKEIFEEFINPYIEIFLNAVYIHKASNLYKFIVVVAMDFIEFERVVFGVAKHEIEINKQVDGEISRSELIRREKNRARKKGAKNAG